MSLWVGGLGSTWLESLSGVRSSLGQGSGSAELGVWVLLSGLSKVCWVSLNFWVLCWGSGVPGSII